MALANTLLLRLTVELRNAGLALVDFLKQAVTLVGVALLVALGSGLTPFFAVQIAVGLVVLALVPRLAGPKTFVAARFNRSEQRWERITRIDGAWMPILLALFLANPWL